MGLLNISPKEITVGSDARESSVRVSESNTLLRLGAHRDWNILMCAWTGESLNTIQEAVKDTPVFPIQTEGRVALHWLLSLLKMTQDKPPLF